MKSMVRFAQAPSPLRGSAREQIGSSCLCCEDAELLDDAVSGVMCGAVTLVGAVAEPACNPDKIAYQMAASGKAITYRELDELSNQGAHLFRSLGLKAGEPCGWALAQAGRR